VAVAEPEVGARVGVPVVAAEPEVVVPAVVLVAELEVAAAAEQVEPVVALAGPVVRVERVALEAKAQEEMLEAQPEEPAGRVAQTTTTILMRIR
jgi:hypothetical protein